MSETKKTIRARYRELEGLKVLDINSTGYVVWLETELAKANNLLGKCLELLEEQKLKEPVL